MIETIRRSQNRETASNNLQTRFKLSEEQAKADPRHAAWSAWPRSSAARILDELAEVKRTIADLQKILANVERGPRADQGTTSPN